MNVGENLQFKYHGNWGGPGYGAGEYTRSRNINWNKEPTDQLDALFRLHDYDYGVMPHQRADRLFLQRVKGIKPTWKSRLAQGGFYLKSLGHGNEIYNNVQYPFASARTSGDAIKTMGKTKTMKNSVKLNSAIKKLNQKAKATVKKTVKKTLRTVGGVNPTNGRIMNGIRFHRKKMSFRRRRRGGGRFTNIGPRPFIRQTNFSMFKRPGSQVVRIPWYGFDDDLCAIYPVAGQSKNFIAIGNNYHTVCNEYVVNPSNFYYTPGAMANLLDEWTEYQLLFWELEYVPKVTQYTCAGEIIVISGNKTQKLHQRELTFDCTINDRYFAYNRNVVMSDPYQQFSAGAWGPIDSSIDFVAQVKGTTEFNPRQFTPYSRFKVRLQGTKGKWFRNGTLGTVSNGPDPTNSAYRQLDFDTWSGPNQEQFFAAWMAIFGQCTDDKTFTDANHVRTLGSFYLTATFKVRGLGGGIDAPDFDVGLALGKDEKFISRVAEKMKDLRVSGLDKKLDAEIEDAHLHSTLEKSKLVRSGAMYNLRRPSVCETFEVKGLPVATSQPDAKVLDTKMGELNDLKKLRKVEVEYLDDDVIDVVDDLSTEEQVKYVAKKSSSTKSQTSQKSGK